MDTGGEGSHQAVEEFLLGWGSLWDLGGSQRALIGQVECVALIFNINGHSHNLYSVPFFSCHCYNEVLCHVVFICHTFFFVFYYCFVV